MSLLELSKDEIEIYMDGFKDAILKIKSEEDIVEDENNEDFEEDGLLPEEFDDEIEEDLEQDETDIDDTDVGIENIGFIEEVKEKSKPTETKSPDEELDMLLEEEKLDDKYSQKETADMDLNIGEGDF